MCSGHGFRTAVRAATSRVEGSSGPFVQGIGSKWVEVEVEVWNTFVAMEKENDQDRKDTIPNLREKVDQASGAIL